MTDSEKLLAISKIVSRMHSDWESHHNRLGISATLEKRAEELPRVLRSLSNGFLDINDIISNKVRE